MDWKGWDAGATLVGAIMGAGVLGLPYVVARAGIIPGIAHILVLGVAMLALNLMLGEVILRTKGLHQLAGYAYKYHGIWGGRLMAVSLILGINGALVAYILGISESAIQLVGGSQFFWIIITLVVMGLLLAQRLTVIEKSERYLSATKILIIVIMTALSFGSAQFTTENLTRTMSWTFPFGVVLFSLLGTAAIPEVREELKNNYTKLKKVLLWSSIIPVIIYLLFVLAVVGVTGGATSEIATVRLGQFLGTHALVLLNVFAVLAMASSFLALGEALKKTYEEDYGWHPAKAWATVMVVPIALVVAGATSFIDIIGITGAFAGGIDGILIVFIYRAAIREGDRRPEYRLHLPFIAQAALLVIFAAAMVWAFHETLALF